MSIFTNYNNLLDDFTTISNPFIVRLQRLLTGPIANYGINTNINVLDVLDQVGIQSAITCLIRATVDTISIQQTVSVDMCNAYASLWPDPSQIQQLLYFANNYLANSNQASTPPRLNACGDLVNVSPAFTPSQILDRINSIQNILNTISLTTLASPIIVTTSIAPGEPALNILLKPDGTHLSSNDIIYDPLFTPLPTTLPHFVLEPIIKALADGTIASQSQQFMVYQTAHPGTGSNGLITVQAASSGNTVDNSSGISEFNEGTATIITAQGILDNSPNLSSVSTLIAQAVQNNAVNQRFQITNIQNALLLISGGSIPYSIINNYPSNNYGVELQASYNDTRNSLLNNLAFWQQYDMNSDGILDMTERYNAEIGFQAALKSAVMVKALVLYNQSVATMSVLLNTTDTLPQILRPYLL